MLRGETPVIPGFSVVDKASDGGSILVREEAVAGKTNKYLDISKEAVGGAANDCVYSDKMGYHDMTTRVQIGFRIRSLAPNRKHQHFAAGRQFERQHGYADTALV